MMTCPAERSPNASSKGTKSNFSSRHWRVLRGESIKSSGMNTSVVALAPFRSAKDTSDDQFLISRR